MCTRSLYGVRSRGKEIHCAVNLLNWNAYSGICLIPRSWYHLLGLGAVFPQGISSGSRLMSHRLLQQHTFEMPEADPYFMPPFGLRD